MVRVAAASAPSIPRSCRRRARSPSSPTAARVRAGSDRAPLPSASHAAQIGRCARGCRASRRNPRATPKRSCQHGMRDMGGAPHSRREASGDRRDHDENGKEPVPAQPECEPAKPDRRRGCDRQNRFTIGGKIERDAGAERDRHPWQKPARSGFRARPGARRRSTRDVHRPAPVGTKPPACAAPYGGHSRPAIAPATPTVRRGGTPRAAIRRHPTQQTGLRQAAKPKPLGAQYEARPNG
jgi:hypothetical protein